MRDSSIAALCSKLRDAAFHLEANERRCRPLYASPVDPKFVSAFRDFDEHYKHILEHLWCCEVFNEDPSLETPLKLDLNDKWNFEDGQASSQAEAVRSAIEFAQANIDQDWRWDKDFAMQIDDGLRAWQQFANKPVSTCAVCSGAGHSFHLYWFRGALPPSMAAPRSFHFLQTSAKRMRPLFSGRLTPPSL